MYVNISNKSVLFYKAYDDLWVAEKTWHGTPNLAVWSCCQAAEKTMKGFLACIGADGDHIHDLGLLLDDVFKYNKLSEDTIKGVEKLSRYTQALRYKNLKSDPTPEDAYVVLSKAKSIVMEICSDSRCEAYAKEALEVHKKMMKAAEETKSEQLAGGKSQPNNSQGNTPQEEKASLRNTLAANQTKADELNAGQQVLKVEYKPRTNDE